MITYKIKERALDPLDSLITKTGADIEFSLRAVENDIAYLQKNKREMISQMALEEAKMKNVVRTHPHIEKMTEEDRIACYIYQQAYAFCKVAENKIKQIDEQVRDYEAEKEEIKNQTGLAVGEVALAKPEESKKDA